MTIVIHGMARVQADMLDAVLTAAALISKSSRAEPGCNRYQFSQDVADPTVLVLMEEWASEEALQTHLASPEFAEFAELFSRAFDGTPEFVRFSAHDGEPLFG
ncbi:putative quinol monooxygenase [Streptomyces sp. CWNU-52B]|uniref:putative quinol monooxygenase n=1 Tax=unclassified Streptomyces TaxID=2593676 RepID=UPI0039C29A8D